MFVNILKKKSIRFLLLIFLLVGLFFAFRSILFTCILKTANKKLETKYHLTLSLKSYSFSGLLGVSLVHVEIGNDADTIFYADTLNFRPRILYLLAGKIRLRKIIINDAILSLNSRFLDSTIFKKSVNSSSLKQSNYSKTIGNAYKELFSYIPKTVNINNLNFSYYRDSKKVRLDISHLYLRKRIFGVDIQVYDSTNNSKVIVSGSIDNSNNYIDLSLYNPIGEKFTLPYITQKWGAWVSFDSLNFKLQNMGYTAKRFNLMGYAYVRNFCIKHKKIAPVEVLTKHGSIDFILHAADRYIELDSSSVVNVNTFSFSPYVRYQNYDGKEIHMKIPRKEFSADALFSSFPEGLFTSIRDMKVTGKLAYSLNASINFSHIDSLIFDSKLERLDFKIQKFGATNLEMLNNPFRYDAYDNDRLEVSFMIDSASQDYVTLDQISPFIKNSVLTSEDADFFYHNGFNDEAFRTSLATDIKEKRFARGGSTISMQLVKNIFLTRNKTISRKLEEAFIVWMIENFHLVSKERMFEIYLNIIEWGPDIYGIKHAAWYYFKKLPINLTLNESIFLANIIPRPKYFKYTFDKDGSPKEFYRYYFRQMIDVMSQRNEILPQDTTGIKPDVTLLGEAKDYLAMPDTLCPDTSSIKLPEIIEDLIPEK
jgi:hypothetical protein